MKSFFGRLKSEIKKSGWAFGVLYFLIIPYIFLISVAEKRVVFESIIILFAIIISEITLII